MTPEQQNNAVAEWCGWKAVHRDGGEWYGLYPGAKHKDILPDYLNDFNAIRDAVGKLPDSMIPEYLNHLANACGVDQNKDFWPVIWNILMKSTSSQQAVALIHTIGKWQSQQKAPTEAGAQTL